LRITTLRCTVGSSTNRDTALDQSLEEIAAMLDLTVNAVKGHLARGRARLKAINAQALAQPARRPPVSTACRRISTW
jgi:Sigma-70, region 4